MHGKGTRKFFRTRQEVDVWLRKTLTRLKIEGEGAIHMPEQMRWPRLVGQWDRES
jgi:hypothetical protein